MQKVADAIHSFDDFFLVVSLTIPSGIVTTIQPLLDHGARPWVSGHENEE